LSEEEPVFALMASNTTDLKVLATPIPTNNSPHNDIISRRPNKTTEQENAKEKVPLIKSWSGDDPIIFCTQIDNTSETLTLIDSGASEHCFADKSLFATYSILDNPPIGLCAGKESTFEIIGIGRVEFVTISNGAQRKISIDDVLHTPELRSNLISVSKLESKGIYITFGSGKACIRTPEGRTIDLGTRLGQLYVVDVSKPVTHALVAQSKQKPVSFETWHRRLGHVGAETMREMISNALVDGFRVEGDLSINGLCEDCLFGKHTAHPYCENTMCKREVLERVHIDIWGPSPIQSAGGCIYFMVIMDGFLSFRTVAFLRNKSADATLKVFKDYHVEAERQTGKKLKSICFDMGREWCNATWKDYRTTHGLNFEYTIPYAHQQNCKSVVVKTWI